MYFVSTQLSLPLFLVTRTRYKHQRPWAVRKYIKKRRRYYSKHCNEGNVNPTETHKRLRHLAGFYEHDEEKCRRNVRILHSTRQLTQPRPWDLPPNLYDVKARPFIALKGIGGALWQKVHKCRSKKKKEKSGWAFYNIPSSVDALLHSRNRHKGVFKSNARDHQPTGRSMIADNSIRYYIKPRPTLYFPKQHLLEYNIAPKKRMKIKQSHIFYPQTCVPARDFPSSIVRPNISFAPGPGRYDIRYPKSCPCSRKIFSPDLQSDIERAKRQKFRRLPYKQITEHRYCTPEWRHVEGQGHRRLFKTAAGVTTKVLERPSVTAAKNLQLYPTAQYINLITNPKRSPLSIWPYGIRAVERPMRFNCIAKRVVRKQLRYNRKIAFDSGRERFSDMERQPSLTAAQIETIKMSLPESRRLRDHPVMRCEPQEIIGRLLLRPKNQPPPPPHLDLRKRLFKFPKLPAPKVLVSRSDVRDKTFDGDEKMFYNRELSVMNYFKNDFMRELYIKHGYHRNLTGLKEFTLKI